ncbi:septation protein A [Sneathiella chinensis]|uniref:Inner membrane-spanning protein YciB n=1 Tax=Sneathiella chinensis TaxID=349750 RepID=A0ABQ5U931_9PROT|nr:septation protein A [Sneathiella chinensis]GLQ07827.1 putative intracellular septation protein A [Sneathiella chinensis]
MSQRKMPQALKTATELGPILLFFGAYYLYDLYVATGAIMITTLISLGVSYYYERTLPAMPLVTAVVVTVFGGLTLYLNDDTFIKMKPTIIYALFAGALIAGLAMGKSFVQALFQNFWTLDDAGWKKLTLRLITFFGVMAIANELVWRNFSTDIWVNIKVFGFTAATFIFFVAQVPLLSRHGVTDPDNPAE